MENIRYGIMNKKTGKMVGFDTSVNEGDCCVDEQHELDEYSDKIWLVDRKYKAMWVLHNSTEWYNAGYETPTHSLNPKDYKIMEVRQVIEDAIEENLLTNEEILLLNYGEFGSKEFNHIKYCMNLEKSKELRFSLFDHLRALEELKEIMKCIRESKNVRTFKEKDCYKAIFFKNKKKITVKEKTYAKLVYETAVKIKNLKKDI